MRVQGELPTPTSIVATSMHGTSLEEQQSQVGIIFEYLYATENPDLAVLNEGTGSIEFLVCTRVQVFHTLQYGTKTLLQEKPMEAKIVGLFGGGNDGESPCPLCIKEASFQIVGVLVHAQAQISDCKMDETTTLKALDVEKGSFYIWHWYHHM